ncbi:MipA/OmpV family protein [Marinomonas sp. THO17]|uniref:MipA/OmpV family protein n=1 Tax=Marinomonas sp. THO17 TaxID=3149048 RepID=UPI00336BC9DB
MFQHAVNAMIVLGAVATPYAQASFQTTGEAQGWLLGGFINAESIEYRQADDFDLSLQPYIAYEWEHLHLGIDGVFYEFYQAGNLTLTLDASSSSAPYEAKDSKALTGLKRSSTIDLGVSANYVLANHLMTQWYWQGEYVRDISGTHHGDSLSTGLGFHKNYARYMIDVSFGISKASSELNQYLYGIETKEVREDRPEYKAKSSFQPYIGIDMHYELSDSSVLVTQLSLEYLSDEVKNSPIVDKSIQTSFLFGWIRFF